MKIWEMNISYNIFDNNYQTNKEMKKKSNSSCILIPMILMTIMLLLGFLYYMLFYSNFSKFSGSSQFSNFAASLMGNRSVCMDKSNMRVLLVGIDYRAGDYLYGLADVIRFAEVDFENSSINMIAIPRDLIVEIPQDRFKVPGPYKVNQAYFFGTPGMENYFGEGNGADSLNEVLEYNFGISADYYMVVNFQAFVSLIDALGGVDVELPEPVYGGKQGDFPQGLQSLSGERALALARIRENYSDEFRVRNQSLIIHGIFDKLLQPATLIKSPVLIAQFQNSILTNFPADQIGNFAFCFQNFDRDKLTTHQVPSEYLRLENLYLTSLNEWSYGYRWDGRFIEWINLSLTSSKE